MDEHVHLSRRERQIMDIIYARGEASVTHVLVDLPDTPARATVRTLLRILEEKGHLKHYRKGKEYVYQPTRPKRRAGQSAMQRVLGTFFEGSLERAVAAHLANPRTKLCNDELKRLAELLRQARGRER